MKQVETDLEEAQERKAVPLCFTSHLHNTEALAGESVDLFCEMSQIGVELTWLKDNQPLSMAGGRYHIINQDFMYHLVMPSVTPDDSGVYTVQAGDLQSTAVLSVEGQWKEV